MSTVKSFVFNPFAENTYLVYDETKQCVIIDPGCYDPGERTQLADFIADNGLSPVKLLNTHCHIDHVFGNKFIAETYGLALETHRGEVEVLKAAPALGAYFGVTAEPSPLPARFLEEGDTVTFGNTSFEVLLTPGHSPASICFYHWQEQYTISGDVLFQQGIGRTDLPGGDTETLMRSIIDKLFALEDGVTVHPGHGPATTIGAERSGNPFVQAYQSGQRW